MRTYHHPGGWVLLRAIRYEVAFSRLDSLLRESKVHVAVEADLTLKATPAVIGQKEPP